MVTRTSDRAGSVRETVSSLDVVQPIGPLVRVVVLAHPLDPSLMGIDSKNCFAVKLSTPLPNIVDPERLQTTSESMITLVHRDG